MLIEYENAFIGAILTSINYFNFFDYILIVYLLVSQKDLVISVFQSLLERLI